MGKKVIKHDEYDKQNNVVFALFHRILEEDEEDEPETYEYWFGHLNENRLW